MNKRLKQYLVLSIIFWALASCSAQQNSVVQQVNALIKQYTEMRRMMQGMFSGGGLRGKMMRRAMGMSGMEGGGDPMMPALPAGLPGSSRRKKKKKKRRR